MEKEAAAMVDAGWEVTVVLPNDKDDCLRGIKIVSVSKPSSRLGRATMTALKVAFKGLKERGDVYHFHDPELIPVGLILRMLGRRVVYDVHETHSATVAHRTYIPRWLRFPASWLFRKCELAAAARFSGIVAATPGISDQFNALRTPRIVVQNFPLLDGEHHPNNPAPIAAPPVAIYMGAMAEGRGLITMIQAMALLPSSLEASLTLAGYIAPALLVKAQAQPGFEKVRLTGRLQREELTRELRRASVGMVVLHPEPNYIASFPTKMFEYMAAGLPVIASDFPLWRSIISENRCGLVVDPLDVKQIAASLEYLLSHRAEATEMGQRGATLVHQRYNWASEREKLLAFYREFSEN